MNAVQPQGRIFVCITCDRYACSHDGKPTPGQRLAAAVKRIAAVEGNVIAVRAVECLNGCPHPCTAALRAPGKAVIRFNGLNEEDAPALLEVAATYAKSNSGEIAPESLPPPLQGKVSDQFQITRSLAPAF